jgi:hypothetical protein
MSKGLFGSASAASRDIFEGREEGLAEDPAVQGAAGRERLQASIDPAVSTGEFAVLTQAEAEQRAVLDDSSRLPVLPSLSFAVFWLIAASTFGLLASLTVGGWLQGLAMLDALRPFMDSVLLTKSCLVGRSVGGTLLTLGHLAFARHFVLMLGRRGDARKGATLLASPLPVGETA